MKKNDIDFELVTAGEYKRTLTIFGENTDKARKKMQEEIEEIHHYFKDFILENRNSLDISAVSTGEYWLASRAKELNLVDELTTSDDYLLNASKYADLYEISYYTKTSLSDRLSSFMHAAIKNTLSSIRRSVNNPNIIE